MFESISLIIVLFVLGWHFYSRKKLVASTQATAIESLLQHSTLPFLDDMVKGIKDKYYIVNSELNVLYGNFLKDDMKNKHIKNVLCPSISESLILKCEEVFQTLVPSFFNYCEASKENYYIKIFPLCEISRENTKYVLVYIHDISMIVNERDRKIEALNQLIALLVSIVDCKDKHTKKHTLLVRLFSEKIAKIMKLDMNKVDHLIYAAALLNFGKILVPNEILINEDHLTPKEKGLIHHAMEEIAKALKQAKMFAPVSKILFQTLERMKATKKEDIKLSKEARILYHINCFIAMISTRQYRNKFSVEQALSEILKECSKKEDKQVYDALVFYLNDAGGRSQLDEK